ncbi:hypothetical protein, partial [Chitinimonas sp. BJB300]|uniref:hypothetical protein n=1 Tax=Chitinimonas sp. BJB300 TaxID=1559339 RepID=UPI000C0F0F0A
YHRRQARCCRRTKRAQQIVGVQIEFFVLHGDRLSYALRNISYNNTFSDRDDLSLDQPLSALHLGKLDEHHYAAQAKHGNGA